MSLHWLDPCSQHGASSQTAEHDFAAHAFTELQLKCQERLTRAPQCCSTDTVGIIGRKVFNGTIWQENLKPSKQFNFDQKGDNPLQRNVNQKQDTIAARA